MSSGYNNILRLLLAQQAGGGAPQFVGAAMPTVISRNSTEVVNIGTAITGIQNGDYVVAVWCSDGRAGQDLTFNTGGGLVGEPASLPLSDELTLSPGNFLKGWVYSTSTPSLSISNASGAASDRDGVLLLAAFRNVQTPASGNVARDNSSSGDPDAPALSGVQSGSIVLAVGLVDDDAETFTAPSGFTIATQGTSAAIGATSNAASAAIAYQTASSTGTVNPGPFSLAGSDSWFAYTIELRAAPAGGGNTWTMTAAANAGIGYSSGTNTSAMGSISNEPVSGLTLTAQVSEGSASSSLRLGFEGDVVSQLSGFTELVVDGTAFTISQWSTFSFIGPLFTRAEFVGNGPTYVDGVTYNCELR